MASPLDSKYLNSPRSPNKNLSISPEKRLTFEDLKNDEQGIDQSGISLKGLTFGSMIFSDV